MSRETSRSRETRGSAIARPRTFLNLVLDESSSMGKVSSRTLEAANAFLHEQRGYRIDELFVTVTLFSDAGRVRTLYKAKPIAKVADLTPNDYRPKGMTALYDGIVDALEDTAKAAGRGDRVLIVIATDGDENDSERVTSLEQMVKIKRAYEERGNWTFVYLGMGAAARDGANDLGFKPGNIVTYTTQDAGVNEGLVKVSQSLKDYRKRDDLATDSFFNPPKQWAKPNWTQSNVVLTDDDL